METKGRGQLDWENLTRICWMERPGIGQEATAGPPLLVPLLRPLPPPFLPLPLPGIIMTLSIPPEIIATISAA